MSALWNWLHSLDEDDIAAWANKGLLRRGAKSLAASAPDADWSIAPDRAAAHIEGFAQSLSGIGFAQLSCSCAALGPCHHLCAFVLGLQQRLPVDEVPAFKSSTEAEWLQLELAGLGRALGAASLRKALRWLSEDEQAELEMQATVLIGRMRTPEEAVVRLPLIGGLEAATCSCRQKACAHRALLVLQARREAGKTIPELPPVTLDDAARQRLALLQDWLLALALQGWAGTGRAFLDQGEALAVEIKQAQMPRVAAAMLTLVALLRRDLARHSGAADQLQDALASIWILINGLQQVPPPRPLRELTGVHRRAYRPARAQDLHCAGVERWETDTGYHGFSVYFWAPEREEYLVWSEGRARELDPNWAPDTAIEHAELGGITLKVLLTEPHRLETGWISEDGRLSGREGTRLVKPDAALAGVAAGQPIILDLTEIILPIASRMLEDPWQAHPSQPHCVCIGAQAALQQDAARQCWFLDVRDTAGTALRLLGSLDGPGGRVHKELAGAQTAGKQLRQVFGRLHIEQGELVMQAISVHWKEHAQACHLTVPWLRIDTSTPQGPAHA